MDIGKRIKALRLSKGLTQKEVGKAVGVSDVSIRAWESGTKQPSASAITALSNTFQVQADYILGLAPHMNSDSSLGKEEKELLTNYRLLDVYGKQAVNMICSIERQRVLAIRDGTASEKLDSERRMIPLYYTSAAAGISAPIDGEDYELIPCDASGSADFAVRIQGSSMMPYIHDGDIVYVERDKEVAIGDVGIFCVDGAMYCKQLFVDENGNMSLLSANPALKSSNVYVSADSGSSVKCYGKVILGCRIPLCV